jgi:hypothetical protein
MAKTIIGKNNYLFLNNDSSSELEIHYNPNYKISEYNPYSNLKQNYFLVVFPDKSVVLKDYLPYDYRNVYRPGIDKYKNILKDKLFDGYDIIKNENDIYYKTDTHMTLKGTYLILKNFIDLLNKNYSFKININDIQLQKKYCDNLSGLYLGLGDLTWKDNLNELILDDISDIYIYSEEINNLYKIIIEDPIKMLDYKYNDVSDKYLNKNFTWDILSNNIIYKKNIDKKYKVLIFYDSFLINIAEVLLNMFNETYFVKNVYNEKIINDLNPDYIFEFRVERFLL